MCNFVNLKSCSSGTNVPSLISEKVIRLHNFDRWWRAASEYAIRMTRCHIQLLSYSIHSTTSNEIHLLSCSNKAKIFLGVVSIRKQKFWRRGLVLNEFKLTNKLTTFCELLILNRFQKVCLKEISFNRRKICNLMTT